MDRKRQVSKRYSDIIHMPHHVSVKHPQMAISDRAAQFSPFAALTGYDAAILETARLTDRKQELDEDQRTILNEKILLLQENLNRRPEVTITYFLPDEKKEGGEYISVTGTVKKIDSFERVLVMVDGSRIPIEDILEIESGIF